MGAIELVEKAQLADRPAMKSGDTVKVHVKVREGDKERIQVFEGVVIGLHRGGTRASFTVRKVSFGQGVERIFPLHSPTIQKVEITRSAKVRRAKLYYLRDLKGKAARMKDVARGLTACCASFAMTRVPAMRTLENALRRVGFVHVAGVDEVGRGCLAGPVVAAAVVLHPDRHIPGVCDSKAVPAAERERLYDRILRHAVAWAVAEADPSEIDRINIHQAVAAGDAAARCWRSSPRPIWCSWTRSACLSCRCRSAASNTAIGAAPRLPPRRSSPRSPAIVRCASCTTAIRATASTGTRAMRPPIT